MAKVFALLSVLIISCTSYRKLHQDAVVVDTHNDVLSTASMKGLPVDTDLTGKTHSDLARFRKGGVDLQVFSIFCDERFGKDTAFKYANREIDSLYAIAGRNTSRAMMVRSTAEAETAVREHKLGCAIG